MTTEACTSFALTAGWTNATIDCEVTDFTSPSVTGFGYSVMWPQWWWPEHHYHYYIQPITVTRDVKVVLKFSEVDRLRKAAQKDEKLKAVLEKLTPCIEVTVDLD